MLPAHNARAILLEVREENETLTYYKVNLDSGESDRYSFPDISWWSRVVFFTDQLVLVQEFDEDSNPDQVKLHMYSWNKGLLWSKDDTRLLEITAQGLMLSGHNKEVDPNTGEISAEAPQPIARLPLEFPWHYTEDDEYFSLVSEFINNRTGDSPVRAIDYFETEGTAVFSYYQKAEEGLRLKLMGVSEDGNVMLNEILADDLQGIADPTFLISEMNIIFVKERRHFFVYGISDR
jgi:hypothetical protein